MDYNANGFTSLTLQLVREENKTKFGPGLSLNLLPEFDMEDNTNSRFDSLVGSEGLLGVKRQEENSLTLNKKNEKHQGNISIATVTNYTSSLQDSNSWIPTWAFSPHPFTDSQQKQLRAQIIVYGSLIREALPDERCMVFAFGESGLVEGVRGGGRSTWETACLVALERIDLQSDTSSTPGRAGGVGDTSSPVQPTLASEPVSSLRDGHQLPTTSVTHIAGVPSSFAPNVSAGSKFVLSTTWSTPPRPNFHVSAGHVNTEQPNGIALSDETCRQIDQAQRQAEEASFLAAAAVKYSQSVWTQLAIQKSSGFVADKEANLASVAVTIAAAAAVAKAAAAGARIASDAALRAKLMADEVLVLPGKLGKSMSDECLPGGVKSMVNFVSPASILKGEDRTNYSDSILVAAREVSKKRVQAASAATRRAENWDAVVKAAVMAAEAVSQASTITAMGEPIPFTLQELAEAGPEDYWKIHQHDQIAKPDSYATSMAEQLEAVCAEEGVTRHIERNLEETEGTSDQGKKVLPPNELSEQVESSNLPVNGMRWGPAGNSEKGLVEPKPEGNRAAHESARISTENQIEEGSVPEVLSCKEGLGWLVWLPAKVLNLKDGKAHVCCTELARCEGPDQREYVLLDGEGGQALRILIPHLVSGLKYEGTRKRQRSAVGDCSWSAGDKVDAHINNGSELATWVRGVELDPAKVDTSEFQKLKTMLEKAMQESRSKDEFSKKLQTQIVNLESRVRSKDQLCKNQQEEVEELAREMHLKLEVQSQYEKQVWQLNDKLKGREEICNDLQRKVIELESKLKERETSVSLALQRKIKELEMKLKEKAQQQSDSVVLQLMARQPESLHPVPPKPLSCGFRDSILYRPVPLREIKRRREMNRMGLANDGLLNLLKKKAVPVGGKVPTDSEKGRIETSKVHPKILLRGKRFSKDAAVSIKGDVTKNWPR